MSKKRKKHIRRTILLVLLALMLIGACCILGFYFGIKNFDKALNEEYTYVTEFEVKSGDTSGTIGYRLESEGIIDSGFVFKYKARFLNIAEKFQVGKFKLSPSMTMSEIMDTLQHNVVKQVKFTIKEGMNLSEIAASLVDQNIVGSKELFYAALEDDYDYWFIPENGYAVGELSAKANRLEGLLFPETYNVDEGSDAHTVINTMLKQFNKVFGDDLKNTVPEGYTAYDMIILASIIEKECGTDDERALISGVFWNRLNIDMRLQSDVTVIYYSGDCTSKSRSLDTPYNTYKNKGLPKAPICCPGIKSINAAINPKETEYLYFVLIGDGSGKCNFAKTYQEHLKNVKIYENNIKKR